MVSVSDQHISARKTLGSFRMANSQGTTQRCSVFIREAQQHDKELLQAVNQSTDSYWHSAHELAEKFVRDGKGPRYAVYFEARSSRRTAAASGELLVTAFYVFSLVFNLRTVPVMSNLLLCRRFLLQGNKSITQNLFT
jgi:hypothetical protein